MTDTELRQMILDELEFEPSIDAADIGVAVEDGVITLTGHVPTYAQRTTTETIVARIKGVRGIAQEIEVRPAGTNLTADDEIARRILDVLRWNTAVPRDAIQVKVAKGWVTLSGSVEWNFHREAADRATNLVTIAARMSPSDVRQRIESAFRRDAELQAAAIRVAVSDGTVTLDGKVHSLAERQVAERAAWSAPGVRKVEDRLIVQ